MRTYKDVQDYVIQFFDFNDRKRNVLNNLVENDVQKNLYLKRQRNKTLYTHRFKPVDFVINQYLKINKIGNDEITNKVFEIKVGNENIFELFYSPLTKRFIIKRNYVEPIFISNTLKTNILNIPLTITLKIKLPFGLDDSLLLIDVYIDNQFFGSQRTFFDIDTLKKVDDITVKIFDENDGLEGKLYDYQVFLYDVDDEILSDINNQLINNGINFVEYMKYSIPTYMDVFYLYQTLFNVKFETNIYYNLIKRKTLNWLFEYGISKKKLLQLQLETHLLKTKTEIFELQYEILTEFENVISKDILFRLMRENRMSFVSQYTVPYKLGLIILSPYQLYDIIRSKMYKPKPNVFRIKTYQYYPTWWRYKYNIYLSSDGKDWFLLQKNKIGQVIEVELPPKGNWQLQFERFELTYDEIPQENLMLKNYTVEQLNEYFKEIEEVSLNVETEI